MLTSQELRALNDNLSTIRGDVKTFTNEFETRLVELEQKSARRPGASDDNGRPGASAVEAKFREALEARADDLKNMLKTRQQVVINLPFDTKSFLATGEGNSPASGYPAPVGRAGGIVDIVRPLTTLDAFRFAPMFAGSLQIPQFAEQIGGPDYQVNEGDAKATTNLGFELLTIQAATIAHVMKASNQVLADVPGLLDFIRGKLLQILRVKTDREVLLGTGAAGHLHGVYTQASAITPIGNSPASSNDEIGYVKAKMQAAGYNPSFVILNPMTAFGIDSERATGGNGQYVSPPAGGKYYGLTPALSTVLTESQALVVDPQAVVIYERESPQLVIGFENDDFSRNLTSVRVEQRLAVAVLDTAGIRRVSL